MKISKQIFVMSRQKIVSSCLSASNELIVEMSWTDRPGPPVDYGDPTGIYSDSTSIFAFTRAVHVIYCSLSKNDYFVPKYIYETSLIAIYKVTETGEIISCER